MRFTGKFHKWNEERGFGVIRPDGGGDDLPVHGSALPSPRPALQDVLTFEVAVDAKGRKRAIEVQRQQAPARVPAADRRKAAAMPEPDRAPRRPVNLTVVRIASVLITVALLWGLGSYISRDLERKRPAARKKAVAAVTVPDCGCAHTGSSRSNSRFVTSGAS